MAGGSDFQIAREARRNLSWNPPVNRLEPLVGVLKGFRGFRGLYYYIMIYFKVIFIKERDRNFPIIDIKVKNVADFQIGKPKI